MATGLARAAGVTAALVLAGCGGGGGEDADADAETTTSSAVPPTTTTTEPETAVHVVQQGETLTAIAARYGTTVAAIAELNALDDPNRLSIGQELRIPGAGAPE